MVVVPVSSSMLFHTVHFHRDLTAHFFLQLNISTFPRRGRGKLLNILKDAVFVFVCFFPENYK